MRFDLFTRIPANIRDVIYAAIGVAITVESTLDAFGYGAVPERPQAAAIAVLGALGFSIARSNVTSKES